MTIVVGFIINKCPLLVGDILISSEEILGKSIELPLTGNAKNVFPEGSGYVPTDLRQKLTVISDNLAIGWSGAKIAARSIIKELIDLNTHAPFTKESFEDYVNNIDPVYVEQGFSFIGLFNDKENAQVLIFKIGNKANFSEFSDDNGSAVLMGSGTDELLNFIKSTGIKPHPENEGIVQATINSGLEYTGALLNFELATWQSLYSYFGAGYELLTIIGSKFVKVRDVTYLFWSGNVSDEDVSLSLTVVNKLTYVDDVLLIRSAQIETIDIENKRMINDQLFIVDPVYRESNKEEREKFLKPSYNSNFICNYFLYQKKGSELLYTFTSIENVNQSKPSIEFMQTDDTINIQFEKSWLDGFRLHIINQIKLQNLT